MDEGRRRHYLAALGIEAWERRLPEPVATPPPTVDRSEPEAVPPPVEVITVVEPAAPPSPVRVQPPEAGADPGIGELDWTELEQRVAECRACDLCRNRTQTVFGVGDRRADWLIIGEAPGAEEDRQGEPFVGPAGQLLNRMLRAVGLTRERVYIANTLKCRPPRNRDPQVAELQACRPYLDRQIALLRPRLLLVVGRVAAQALLVSDASMGRLRGQVHRLPGTEIPLVATYHPAYLLRSPGQKRRVWEDLLLAREVSGEVADGGSR